MLKLEPVSFTLRSDYQSYKLEREDTPEGRYYTTPSGERYESVTTALGRLDDKSGLAAWRQRVGEAEAEKITKKAAQRGTEVHELLERFIRGEVESTRGIMPHVLEMFRKVEPHLRKNVSDVYLLESSMWSDRLRMAGTVDCVAEWKGRLSVVDFKTSRMAKPVEWINSYFLQTAAYAEMFKEMYGQPIEQIVILMATEEGPERVFLSETDQWIEHDFFKSRINSASTN